MYLKCFLFNTYTPIIYVQVVKIIHLFKPTQNYEKDLMS